MKFEGLIEGKIQDSTNSELFKEAEINIKVKEN